jgi:hypothetical protein
VISLLSSNRAEWVLLPTVSAEDGIEPLALGERTHTTHALKTDRADQLQPAV